MFSPIVTIFLFFVVITLTAVVFFGWVAIMLIRAIISGVGALFAPRARPGAAQSTGVRCQVHGCQAVNPPDARFCRRCGRGLPTAQRVQVRRAAVW